MTEGLPGYWHSLLVFERALAAVYLIAFLCAANQFVPLLGERGLLPVTRFIRVIPFRSTPSLFYFVARDGVSRAAPWLGVALAALALAGYPQQWGTAWSAAVWAALWILYLSFVNVGQTFYAFGPRRLRRPVPSTWPRLAPLLLHGVCGGHAFARATRFIVSLLLVRSSSGWERPRTCRHRGIISDARQVATSAGPRRIR